jgi:hypothetical protein
VSLLNCVISKSPFVLSFLPQLADFLQVQVPLTPLNAASFYVQRLVLLGGFLRGNKSPRFEPFYEIERRILMSQTARALALHFPEFFDDNSPPATDPVALQLALIDPGTVRGSFARLISSRGDTPHSPDSLSGRSSRSGSGSPPPGAGARTTSSPASRTSRRNLICVSNPGQAQLLVHIRGRGRLPGDMTVLVSHSAMFDDDVVILTPRDFTLPLGDTYFSVVGLRQTWDVLQLELPGVSSARQLAVDEVVEIDIAALRERFIADMQQFACVWTDADTDQLLASLPRFALRDETFGQVEAIVKGSTLCTKFPVAVVVLRTLVFHYFNFLREKRREDAPASLCPTRFVCPEGVAGDVMR